jgi:regulator of RNase E activity RraA
MFARSLSVSHSYAHVYDFGGPVEIGQMKVSPGDLLHGDRHGIQTVPLEIAEKVPAVAQRMRAEEQEMMEFCRSEEFTVEKLRSKVEALKIKRRNLRD